MSHASDGIEEHPLALARLKVLPQHRYATVIYAALIRLSAREVEHAPIGENVSRLDGVFGQAELRHCRRHHVVPGILLCGPSLFGFVANTRRLERHLVVILVASQFLCAPSLLLVPQVFRLLERLDSGLVKEPVSICQCLCKSIDIVRATDASALKDCTVGTVPCLSQCLGKVCPAFLRAELAPESADSGVVDLARHPLRLFHLPRSQSAREHLRKRHLGGARTTTARRHDKLFGRNVGHDLGRNLSLFDRIGLELYNPLVKFCPILLLSVPHSLLIRLEFYGVYSLARDVCDDSPAI